MRTSSGFNATALLLFIIVGGLVLDHIWIAVVVTLVALVVVGIGVAGRQ